MQKQEQIWLDFETDTDTTGIMFYFRINFSFIQLVVIHLKKKTVIDPDSLFRKSSRSLRAVDSGSFLAISSYPVNCWHQLMQGSVTISIS